MGVREADDSKSNSALGLLFGRDFVLRLAVAGISVKTDGSDSWSALDVPALSDISGRNGGVAICASLTDPENGFLAENAVGLKIAFGNSGALASYCAEIEAVGHPSVDPTVVVFR